jgi:hypothetical protein
MKRLCGRLKTAMLRGMDYEYMREGRKSVEEVINESVNFKIVCSSIKLVS